MKLTCWCLAWALLTLAAWPSEATRAHFKEQSESPQQERKVLLVPNEVLAKAGFDRQASAGLFVGINEFEDRNLVELRFAVDDAVDLAHLFTIELKMLKPSRVVLALGGKPQKMASRVRLEALRSAGANLAAASKSEIEKQLCKQLAVSKENGVFVLTIATHGFSDKSGDFLMATDSLQGTGMAVGELLDPIARAPAPRRIVLLDACRERLLQGTRSPKAQPESMMQRSFVSALGQASGSAVLVAAQTGGWAYEDAALENGVFSASIIAGLRGEAGSDEEGLITVATLAKYCNKRINAWIKANRPDHWKPMTGITQLLEGFAANMPLAMDSLLGESTFSVKRDPPVDVYAPFEEPETVHVPAGKFLMGTSGERIHNLIELNPSWRASWFVDERPQREVYLPAFRIGKYEVTNREYKVFLDSTARSAAADRIATNDLPIVDVTYYDALNYCKWLSDVTGKNYSLPTQAQWEKAARGGDQREYPWGNNEPTSGLAVFQAPGPQRVGQRPEGPYGACDMAGNVSEWCVDGPSDKHAPGSLTGRDAPVRGGSFKMPAFLLRAAARLNRYDRSVKKPDLGFRVVLNLDDGRRQNEKLLLIILNINSGFFYDLLLVGARSLQPKLRCRGSLLPLRIYGRWRVGEFCKD